MKQKPLFFATTLFCLFASTFSKANAQLHETISTKKQALNAFNKLNTQLTFIKNNGQWNKQVQYVAKMPNQNIWFTNKGLRFDAYTTSIKNKEIKNGQIFDMEFVQSNKKNIVYQAEDLKEIKTNYLIGKSKTNWIHNVKEYKSLLQKNVYNGIDVHYYKNNLAQFEYDIVVAPNANVEDIKIKYKGLEKGVFLQQGKLHLKSKYLGDIVINEPIAYQINELGNKQFIACNYTIKKINGQQMVAFETADYDKNLSLIIDPTYTISWVTYAIPKGTGNQGYITGIKTCKNGEVIIVGETINTDKNLPSTSGAYQEINNGKTDGYIIKLKSDGLSAVWATYLGGVEDDFIADVAIDDKEDIYVVGGTFSDNFPIAGKAPQQTNNGNQDCFIAKVSADGSSLIFSTYLGGRENDMANGMSASICVDANHETYVTGTTLSSDFPIVGGTIFQSSFAGNHDAFVTKLSANGEAWRYSTYVGGIADDFAASIAVNSKLQACIMGNTYSDNFPTANAIQPSLNSSIDDFVVKLEKDGSQAIFSTYWGGKNAEFGNKSGSIAYTSKGDIVIIGLTASDDLQTTPDAYQKNFAGGGNDLYITKLSADGKNNIFTTYLGGSSTECPKGEGFGASIDLDANDNIIFKAHTSSNDFPITIDAVQKDLVGGTNIVYGKLSSYGKDLQYSSYFGVDGSYDEVPCNHCVNYNQALDCIFVAFTPDGPSASDQATPSSYQTTSCADCGTIFKSCNNFVAPIKQLSFDAKLNNNVVNLNWITIIEINTKNFEIERSTDGINFKTIGVTIAKLNNSNNYTFIDNNPIIGTNFYRLKINDINNSFDYTKTLKIILPKQNQIVLIENPVTTNLLINSSYTTPIIIVDALGKQIKKYNILKGENVFSLATMASGIYFIKTNNETIKFVKK